MAAIDYEALRARHAETRPLERLTDAELEAVAASMPPTFTPLHDLAFLAMLEVNQRAGS